MAEPYGRGSLRKHISLTLACLLGTVRRRASTARVCGKERLGRVEYGDYGHVEVGSTRDIA